MHAAYLFLIHTDLSWDDGMVKGAVLNTFEDYADKHCDENNWYQPMLVVCQDGRIIQCAGSGDHRGRDGMYTLHASLPAEKRWETVVNLAWGIASVDLSQSNPFFGSKDDRRLSGAAELRELLPGLRQQAGEKIGAADGFEQWKGKHLLEAVEAAEKTVCPPFSTLAEGPDCNWRCWDLRDAPVEALGPNDVVLVVDIHT